MDKIIVAGGKRLKGSVKISGAKNSALPIMAATLLTRGNFVIKNVPHLEDVTAMSHLLVTLGANIIIYGNEIEIKCNKVKNPFIPYDLVRKMRASICLLGPLLARFGKVEIAYPGGCVIGPRPVDLHLKGLKKLGAQIEIEHGYIVAKATDGLRGDKIYLGGPFGSTVLGTANVMMAATLARGETIIEGAACEPEIVDLAAFLNTMGARIAGAGTHILQIEGVEELRGAEHTIIPDRIEAGTYLVATAISGGDVLLKEARYEHMMAVIDRLEEAGVEIERASEGLRVKRKGKLKAVDATALPYPGFPTDMQAQMMSLMSIAEGTSIVTDMVYPDRFIHVGELLRMGANIVRQGPRATVIGVEKLSGAQVTASDLRASAALILAGLAADGETEVSRVYHLDRGYEKIEEKLSGLGADIKRVAEEPSGEKEK
jgi:UDP-N-acetylglucosamine 1-carboxyvinyltransferase